MNTQLQHQITVPGSFFGILRRIVGESSLNGSDTLREVGIGLGRSIAEDLGGRLGSPGGTDGLSDADADEFWQEFSDLLDQYGWGSTQHERLHPGVVSLSSPDWFEADSGESAPGCHLSVGMLGEVFRLVSGLEVSVLEVKCCSAGDSHCRFLIGSVDAVQAVYESISSGRSYRDAVAALG